ncbi:carbohydrate ABC transporter substrate-binding protein [Oscillospiraceae bacterium 50-58]
MKKMLSLLLASAMSLSLLVGCGGAPQTPPAQSNPPAGGSSTSQGDASTPQTPTGPIKVAALASAYEETYPGMWQEVCDAFTTETGIEVDLIVDKALEDVIGPSMQGGDFPDVIHLATGRDKKLTEQFIKDKNIADITDVLSMTVPGESAKVSDKIVPGFTDTSITNPYGDGKTYLAPMFYSPCGLFYNAGLFAEKGWTVPTTWDEMWALGDKAAAEDIALFTYPTTGYFDTFFPTLLYSAGGPEFFNQAMNYAEGVWDTPEAKQCFDVMSKLASYTAKVTPAQANDSDFTQNQQLILNNKALFIPNGTWLVSEMADAPREDGFQWGMCALPGGASGTSASYCWMEQAWIPAQAPNLDAAKQFVAFLYSDKAADIFAKGGAAQPITGITDSMEGDNKIFYSIYDNGASAVMGGFAAYASVPGLGSVREVFFDPFNSLVNGSLTADQWVADIKAASDQMRANLLSE